MASAGERGRLFTGGDCVGLGWFLVEFARRHAFGGGVDFPLAEEFFFGWVVAGRRPRCRTRTWGTHTRFSLCISCGIGKLRRDELIVFGDVGGDGILGSVRQGRPRFKMRTRGTRRGGRTGSEFFEGVGGG